MNQNKLIAVKQYSDRQEAVQQLLRQLGQDVALHGRQFRRDPHPDPGCIGDLEHIQYLLQQVVDFLQNKDKG